MVFFLPFLSSREITDFVFFIQQKKPPTQHKFNVNQPNSYLKGGNIYVSLNCLAQGVQDLKLTTTQNDKPKKNAYLLETSD